MIKVALSQLFMRKIKLFYYFIFAASLLTGYGDTFAQAPNTHEKILPKIHSVYIYHLTKYFLWPPQNLNQDHFIIGIVGDGEADISKELKTMAETKKANGQQIVIRHFDTPAEMSTDCHIVYIPYESSNYLSDILMKTQKSPVLIVTAKEGLGKVGSPVNLITIDGKTSFELNIDAIEKRSLKFAQQLKAIATLI